MLSKKIRRRRNDASMEHYSIGAILGWMDNCLDSNGYSSGRFVGGYARVLSLFLGLVFQTRWSFVVHTIGGIDMQVVIYLFAGVGLAWTALFIAIFIKKWRKAKHDQKPRG